MRRLVLALPFALTFACGPAENGTPDASDTDAGSADAGPTREARCTTPRTLECEEEIFTSLDLKSDPAPGLIENDGEQFGWKSTIDARAGVPAGSLAAAPDGYVYARFTEEGLEKVDIDDEAALASMGWDIAFKRYFVRINSGFSGPSCVDAASLAESVTYDDVTELPANLNFVGDEWMADCAAIEDGTGLPGSNAFRLRNYWTYEMCVQTTGRVFVIALADGRHVKLAITHYYNDTAQSECNADGTISTSNRGSATLQVRWAFLD